jgi:peptide/nickel transport system ATP-binding protein
MKLLTVKNLKVHFKHDSETVKAVDGIDFAVNENEVLGLVGESGSGKSVTALSIMKLLPEKSSVQTGEIICEGKPAIVFQEPFTSLNPVLRVGEQIDEAVLAKVLAKGTGLRSTPEPSLKLLEKVKISDPQRIYDSFPHMLSGGERQRAMIAMAIALNPKLLIADEPTTALDVTIQAGILELILGLKRDLNMSVLFITHDFGIINKVADRVLVMKEGKIVESGAKSDILSRPREDYTKKLLDAVPKITHARQGRLTEGGTIIAVKNLNKTFAVEKGIFRREQALVQAVRNINFEVKESRTLGLVGESGSGKTTLGKLIMGLLEPDSGSVETQKSTQIVFQDPYNSLDPRMKIKDIVLEGPTIQGMQRQAKEKILRDVLFKAHLNYKDRSKYPHQFSGGERQRIAIARALAVNPRILILDEPVSSLDVIIQSEILNLLKHIQKELSLTYIFISHDLRVVEYMADEVAVMYKGEIVELAASGRIYQSPGHPYTKRLLSSILQL